MKNNVILSLLCSSSLFLGGSFSMAAEPDQLGDIVVTAQKRDQKLQDVPIAVSVLSSQALESRGLKSVEDLSTATPGLQIGSGAASILPFLRGVGSNATSTGNEASVASYIDGVYYSVLPIGFFTFSNIDHLEVLKGPQGTLFGRNSSGGVIHIITKDPSQDFGVKGSLGYGNYDTLQGDLYMAGGLADNLSADISISGRRQGDGYGTNVTTLDKNNYMNFLTLRSKILFRPAEGTRITLSPFYAYSIGTLTAGTYPGTVGGYASAPFDPRPTLGFYDSSNNDPNIAENELWGGSLKVEQEFSFANFSSISAYSHSSNDNQFDTDVSERPDIYATYDGKVKQFTQEFQLSSNTPGPLEWTAGLFYFHSDVSAPTYITGPYSPLGPQGGGLFGKTKTDSYSVYGQATYEVAPDLHLTGGLRYSIDKSKGEGEIDLFFDPLLVIPATPEKKTFKKLTYKASIDYRFSPEIMAYATISRGYKSGLFNVQPFDGSFSRPEVLDDYEIGFKSDLFDRRVRLNASAFYYDIQDPQTQILGVAGVTYSNAESARVYGAEFDAQMVLADGLTGRLAATWLDGKYKDYKNAPSGPPLYVPPYGSVDPFVSIDASGNRMVQSPEFTASAGFDYVIDMAKGKLTLTGDYFYNDGFYWEPNNILRQKAYHLVSGQIAYAPTDNISISVWGKNLANEKYASRTGAQGRPGFPMVAAPPRTYGMTASFNF